MKNERLRVAVESLVGAGRIQDRLAAAWLTASPVHDDELPTPAIRERFERLRAGIVDRWLPPMRFLGRTPFDDRMTDDEASRFAQELFAVYHDVKSAPDQDAALLERTAPIPDLEQAIAALAINGDTIEHRVVNAAASALRIRVSDIPLGAVRFRLAAWQNDAANLLQFPANVRALQTSTAMALASRLMSIYRSVHGIEMDGADGIEARDDQAMVTKRTREAGEAK